MSRCIGFGERDSRRASPAKHCRNEADTPAGLWCSECEAERRAHIDAQMAEVTRGFEKPWPERVPLDRCTGCGYMTMGAWMHGPCPVCGGERYEAGEYGFVGPGERHLLEPVQDVGVGYRASCQCGWIGEVRRSRSAAMEDREAHRAPRTRIG